MIACGAYPSILLAHILDSLIIRLSHYYIRGVGRTIINHDEFPINEGLVNHRLNSSSEPPSTIKGGNDDANQ